MVAMFFPLNHPPEKLARVQTLLEMGPSSSLLSDGTACAGQWRGEEQQGLGNPQTSNSPGIAAAAVKSDCTLNSEVACRRKALPLLLIYQN
jgi:hypothetical protein